MSTTHYSMQGQYQQQYCHLTNKEPYGLVIGRQAPLAEKRFQQREVAVLAGHHVLHVAALLQLQEVLLLYCWFL